MNLIGYKQDILNNVYYKELEDSNKLLLLSSRANFKYDSNDHYYKKFSPTTSTKDFVKYSFEDMGEYMINNKRYVFHNNIFYNLNLINNTFSFYKLTNSSVIQIEVIIDGVKNIFKKKDIEENTNIFINQTPNSLVYSLTLDTEGTLSNSDILSKDNTFYVFNSDDFALNEIAILNENDFIIYQDEAYYYLPSSGKWIHYLEDKTISNNKIYYKKTGKIYDLIFNIDKQLTITDYIIRPRKFYRSKLDGFKYNLHNIGYEQVLQGREDFINIFKNISYNDSFSLKIFKNINTLLFGYNLEDTLSSDRDIITDSIFSINNRKIIFSDYRDQLVEASFNQSFNILSEFHIERFLKIFITLSLLEQENYYSEIESENIDNLKNKIKEIKDEYFRLQTISMTSDETEKKDLNKLGTLIKQVERLIESVLQENDSNRAVSGVAIYKTFENMLEYCKTMTINTVDDIRFIEFTYLLCLFFNVETDKLNIKLKKIYNDSIKLRNNYLLLLTKIAEQENGAKFIVPNINKTSGTLIAIPEEEK